MRGQQLPSLLALLGCLLAVVHSTAAQSPAAPTAASSPAAPSCKCSRELKRVCAGGQEFGNACLAKCAGYDTFTDGPCSYNSGVAVSAPGAPKWRPACPCPFDWRPVCASADGGKSFRTFGNECAAKCVSAVVKTKGECYAEVVPDDNLDGVADAGAAPPVKRLSAPDETPGAVGSMLPSACPCPAVMDGPVCGTVSAAGQLAQFASSCIARCKGARDIVMSACPAPPPAPANAPAAAAAPAAAPAVPAAGAPAAGAGAGGACSCPRVFRRVCGKDGQTYNNDCLARCAGTEAAAEGQCSGDECKCPLIYSPVCGADGNTWGNDCAAKCAGVVVKAAGECGYPSDTDFTKADTKPGVGLSSPKRRRHRHRNSTAPGATGAAPTAAAAAPRAAAAAPRAPPAAASVQVAPAAPAAAVCRCTREFAPLCGLDGKSYANPCLAKCAGVGQAYPGGCSDVCKACPTQQRPVCGVSRLYGPRTYANCCFLKCNGLSSATDALYEGECKVDACVKGCLDKPRGAVCCGGQTFASDCLAKCRGAAGCKAGACDTTDGVEPGVACLFGRCPRDCRAADKEKWDPVCTVSASGRREAGRCWATCDARAAVVFGGPCAKAPPAVQAVKPDPRG